MKYNLGDKLTINGVVFTVVDDGNQVKPSLSEIISEGQARIHNAVEAVIAKHEREVKDRAHKDLMLKAKWGDGNIEELFDFNRTGYNCLRSQAAASQNEFILNGGAGLQGMGASKSSMGLLFG